MLADSLRRAAKPKLKGPVWRGPEEDGITFSLLSRFLVCRERFRLLAIEGLQPMPMFNHRIEYGNLWHCAEETLANTPATATNGAKEARWQDALKQYCLGLCKRYPTQQEQVDHWYNVCKTQFPVYVDYWAKHPDVTERTPFLAEQTFAVPIKLPSGRTVKLRGKWDSVDIVGKGKERGLWLQENKTKGDIDEVRIKRQLTFDLQTMLYLVALTEHLKGGDPKACRFLGEVKGVRYNVVRRPLSGGKGTIKRKEPSKANPLGETKEQFYARLRDDYLLPEPEYWFMRWAVNVSAADIARFRRECLDPILEQLCLWWDWIQGKRNPDYDVFSLCTHWRHPFGCYNILDEGGSSDLDAYLDTGSEVGLHRTDNLFPELT